MTRLPLDNAGLTTTSSGPDPAAASPAPIGIKLRLYDAAMRVAEPLVPVILSRRAKAGKEDPARRGERLGIAAVPRPPGELAWIHAASVGELNAVLPLMAALRAGRPSLRFLVTTGTTTSAALAAGRLNAHDIHQYIPLDVPRFVRRFLDHWQPNLAVFTESELWPNLIIGAANRKIPLALVNGRLSVRSYDRWLTQQSISRPLLSRFAVILAQSEKLSRWFSIIGARRTITAGNLKVDAPPLPVDERTLHELQAALGTRPRLLIACTHEGEEEMAADAHRSLTATVPDLCTIIAPRHPERGVAIATLLQARGIKVTQRSAGHSPDTATEIYIADTIGELGTLYRLCPVAYLGKSYGAGPATKGGQNPIEAIRHGAAVLTGPHVGNFQEIYRALFEHKGAVVVESAAALSAAVRRLLDTPAALAELNAGATAACTQLSGALALTVETLLTLLPAVPIATCEPAGDSAEAPAHRLVRAS